MAADSNMAPVVGQQVTLAPGSAAAASARLSLLEQRADITSPLPECDLIVRGVLNNIRYSAIRLSDGNYRDTDGNNKTSTQLRTAAAEQGNVLTFSCLPPGSGRRVALNAQ
jgi:hypothetical protein